MEKPEDVAADPPIPGVTSDEAISAPATPKNEEEYIAGLKLFLVIVAVTLVCFLVILDISIVATAIPQITSTFNSLQDVGWYGSAYLIANCAFLPQAGKIYAFYNSKWTFLSFFALFEFGSLLCGVSTSSKMLIISRAVAGLGGSGLVSGALTIIADTLPMHKRPKYLGIVMSVGQLGLVLGPLIGGALTQYATWRWCFYINLPIGAVAAAFLVFLSIPDHTTKAGKTSFTSLIMKLDIPGFFLFAPAAVQLLLALEWGGNRNAWNSATTVGLLVGAAATFCLFLVWEYYQGDVAMVPFSMMRRRIVWTSCVNVFFFYGGLYVVTYYLPLYFQAVKGVSPTLSGVDLLPMVLFQILSSFTSGILVGRLGYYLPWIIGANALIAIANGLLSTLTPLSSIGKWVGFEILAGVGRGCGLQMAIIAVQNAVPPAQIPVAMSTLTFSQNFGGALFLTFAQLIFSNGLSKRLHIVAPDVDAGAVIAAGARSFRDVVSQNQLPRVLDAYSQAISQVFYLAAGMAVAGFIVSWGMGWKSVKKPKVVKPEA